MWRMIADAIARSTGRSFRIHDRQGIGGGCINTAYRLADDAGRAYFVKLNDAARVDMFESEAQGLQEIARTRTVRVPAPVCWGKAQGSAYLALEYIELTGGGLGMSTLGARLAGMHRATQPRFGWRMDNAIGSTPQINTPREDWVAFWREQRLGFQLRLAARNGHGGNLQRKGERLMGELHGLFGDYRPVPSLLHGDLWGGNCACDAQGQPVIFDPAVYYGDREADLAMTELFGGFGADFYAAYRDAYPLDPGYTVRRTLYNLYHVLNHLNLFGGGYRAQAERMVDVLLGELG